MNEFNAVSRRHPEVKISSLQVDTPVFVRGLIEEMGVKRWAIRLMVIGVGLLLIEQPPVIDTLRQSIEAAFASDTLSKDDRRALLQASSAEELDYIRSFFPELQAPQHIEDLQTFGKLLVSDRDSLPIAQSDLVELKRATDRCITLLRTSLPLDDESALTAAMMYDGQLDKCQSETPIRARRFLSNLGLLTAPSKRQTSTSELVAQWKRSH